MRRTGPAAGAVLLVAVSILAIPACEKTTFRDSRREYQSILSSSMSDDERARALESFVRRYPEPKTNPNLSRACQQLAIHHARAGRPEIASSWYERALRADPDDPDLLNRLGYHYASAGMNLDRAVEVLELAVRLAEERNYPERRQGMIKDSLGWAYRMRGDLPRAVALLEEACRLAPGVPILREHLAETYRALGERDRALEIFLDLYVEGRGSERRHRESIEALAAIDGPGAVQRTARRIQRRLQEIREADRRTAESDGATLVVLNGADGQPIVGSLYRPVSPADRPSKPPDDRGAVLLLHGLGSDRGAAVPTARLLARRGLFVLALDMRGHGASVSERLATPMQFSDRLDASLANAQQDAVLALQYLRALPGVDRERLGAGGEGLGGLVALGSLGQVAPARSTALVILSPWGQAAAYRPLLEHLGSNSVLLVAGRDDPSSSGTIAALAEESPAIEGMTVPGGKKGFDLLRENAALRERVAQLFTGSLR